MPFTAGSVNMFLLSIFKWNVLDSFLITYRVGDFFSMIVSFTVLSKKCRCVTEKWFLCVCLGYDWILWGVNLNICHILKSYTSKGINLAMPKSVKLITELCPFRWSVRSHWRSWSVESRSCDPGADTLPARKGLCDVRPPGDVHDGGVTTRMKSNSFTFFFFFWCALKYQS